jgi:hypothetical protein
MALPLIAAGFARLIAAEAAESGAAFGPELESLLSETGIQLEKGQTSITIPVSSSAIRSIGYNVGGVITVEFNTRGTYDYMGSPELFIAFATAPSKGAFFNEHIK